MKKLFLWALSALLTLPAAAQDFVPEASFYGENYWTPDTLGNHRAIVSVNTPASVAEIIRLFAKMYVRHTDIMLFSTM